MSGYNIQDGYALKQVASEMMYARVFQGRLPIEGSGINMAYSSNMEAQTISVPYAKPSSRRARRVGGSTNGAIRNTNGIEDVQMGAYDLPLTYVYDERSAILDLGADMSGLKGKIADQVEFNIAGVINNQYNATYLANVMQATFEGVTDASKLALTYDKSIASGNGSSLNAFIDASVLLNNGDPAQNINYWSADKRQAFIRPVLQGALGKSNFTVATALPQYFNSFVNPFTQEAGQRINLSDGQIGYVNGVLATITGDFLFSEAKYFLGIVDGDGSDLDLAINKIDGIIVAGEAVLGGLALGSTDVRTSTENRQVNILPLARWGFKLISKMAVKFIVNTALETTDITALSTATLI